MTNEQIKQAHATELKRTKFLAQKELERLREEKRDALDRSDLEELKEISKATHELNTTIARCNKALRELEAE